ncbi:hypothetical protein N752_01825 [Desulforamulus aquiferis]|nr:copper amine oxidase N-terminal domain-containing protein [Desulforamulus aquiferis]RYD06891.1 hypothetical protein N752_01825 [Desulforamulus aquiferis]
MPTGPVNIELAGTAINQTDALFPGSEGIKWHIADVVDGTNKINTVFTVNSNVFIKNGVIVQMDVAPYISDGRVFVPVRYLANSLGVTNDELDFNNNQVIINKGHINIELEIDNKVIKVNGQESMMDVSPVILDGRTMLPARYITEAWVEL